MSEGPDRTSADLGGADASVVAPGSTRLPSFPKRFLDVFFSPGALAEALRDHPAWALAMIVGAVFVAAQIALIPADVWASVQREAALQAGREMPAMPPNIAAIMRFVAPIGAGVATMLFAFLLAGITTVLFAFVLGDEGTYRQYLAVLSHSFLIPATVGLLLLPLKISQVNPQFTLNLGSFFGFLPDGYLLKFLTMMDLSQVWSWLVVAAGAHAIDPRRSFGSAAAILLILQTGIIMLLAIWVPMP